MIRHDGMVTKIPSTFNSHFTQLYVNNDNGRLLGCLPLQSTKCFTMHEQYNMHTKYDTAGVSSAGRWYEGVNRHLTGIDHVNCKTKNMLRVNNTVQFNTILHVVSFVTPFFKHCPMLNIIFFLHWECWILLQALLSINVLLLLLWVRKGEKECLITFMALVSSAHVRLGGRKWWWYSNAIHVGISTHDTSILTISKQDALTYWKRQRMQIPLQHDYVSFNCLYCKNVHTTDKNKII